MWPLVLLLIIIVLPLGLFWTSSNMKKSMNKDIEKNPYDYRNNPPPPPGTGRF